MSTRGEYRSTFVSIWDDDEYLDLSMGAKMVHRYLRDTNGALGVGRLSHVQAAAAIGCSRAELGTALEELERATPRRPAGWIVRDGLHVWVIAALADEPNLQFRNPKHQSYIKRLIKESDAPAALLARVSEHYADWLPDTSAPADPEPATAAAPTDTLSDTLSNGYRMGTDTQETRDRSPETDTPRSVGDLGTSPAPVREEGAATDRPTEGGASARTTTTPGRADPPGVPSLAGELASPNVAAWLRRFYAGATVERRADVEQQLLAMLTPEGAPTDRLGEFARCSLEELDAQCQDQVAARRDPDNPELAIVYLLRNVARGRKPARIARRDAESARLLGRIERRTAAATQVPRAGDDSRQRTDAAQAQLRAQVTAWAAEHPAEFERLREIAEADVSRSVPASSRAVLVEARLDGLVFERIREAEAVQPAGSGT